MSRGGGGVGWVGGAGEGRLAGGGAKGLAEAVEGIVRHIITICLCWSVCGITTALLKYNT